MAWVGHVVHMDEMRNTCKLLAGKPEGRRWLRRHRYRLEDVRMDPKEVGWEGVDWMHLIHGRDWW